MIVGVDDSTADGEDGVAVAAAKAADIERIAAADDDSADSFEEEEVPTEGADDDDSEGDSEDEDGEGSVWCWFDDEEVGEVDNTADEVST